MVIDGYATETQSDVNEAICQALRHNFRKLIRLKQDKELATGIEELRGEKITEGWEGKITEAEYTECDMEHMLIMEAEAQEEGMNWMEEDADAGYGEMEELERDKGKGEESDTSAHERHEERLKQRTEEEHTSGRTAEAGRHTTREEMEVIEDLEDVEMDMLDIDEDMDIHREDS